MEIEARRQEAKKRAVAERERLLLAIGQVSGTREGRDCLLWVLRRCGLDRHLDVEAGQIALRNLGIEILGQIRQANESAHMSILNDLFAK